MATAPAHHRDDEVLSSHTIVVALVAIAFFVAVWVGLIALAVSVAHVGYGPPLGMAAAVGVLAGVFWAGWYTFVSYASHEEHDRHR